MTAKEIESLVKANKALPSGLNIAEQNYFMSLQSLARSPQSKQDKARAYKMFLQSFEECQNWIKIYQENFKMRIRLAKVSKQMVTGDCPICKEAIKIIDNR